MQLVLPKSHSKVDMGKANCHLQPWETNLQPQLRNVTLASVMTPVTFCFRTRVVNSQFRPKSKWLLEQVASSKATAVNVFVTELPVVKVPFVKVPVVNVPEAKATLAAQ